MSSPTEKAKELMDKFYPFSRNAINTPVGWIQNFEVNDNAAKSCAKMAVEEIIPCTWKLSTYKGWGFIDVAEETTTEYWQ